MICRHKLYHFMVANLVLGDRGAVKRIFATVKWYIFHACKSFKHKLCYHHSNSFWKNAISKCFCYVAMSRCFHGINAMILMLQIFNVTANENACYKRNDLESMFYKHLVLWNIDGNTFIFSLVIGISNYHGYLKWHSSL